MRFSQLNSRTALAGVAALAILLTAVLSTVGRTAPPLTSPIILSGIAGFPVGSAGIAIGFPNGAKIIGANYAVVVQQTNTAGYSTTSECTYFNGCGRQGCESYGVKVPCRQLPDSDG
ncbi:MAG TPA: hypothetical protein VN937_12960 [Blastocatellia bacterium]|nr:hypothetical protein [Blastocatellia bacterium]